VLLDAKQVLSETFFDKKIWEVFQVATVFIIFCIFRETKLMTLKWMGYVRCVAKMKKIQNIMGKPGGRNQLEDPCIDRKAILKLS
jgi:hypothetical protein